MTTGFIKRQPYTILETLESSSGLQTYLTQLEAN